MSHAPSAQGRDSDAGDDDGKQGGQSKQSETGKSQDGGETSHDPPAQGRDLDTGDDGGKQGDQSKQEDQQPQNPEVTPEQWSSASFVPHPDILRQYNQIIKNAPERFMRMAEEEQKRRHKDNRIVILFNFFVSLFLIVASMVCAKIGQPWPASVLAAAAAGGTLAVTLLTILSALYNKK